MIYCDPPYENSTSYHLKDFNHLEFWQWTREKTIEGHLVFISEYKAPKDFVCIWKKELCSSLTKETGSKRGVEKLFMFNHPFNEQCLEKLERLTSFPVKKHLLISSD